MQPERFCSPDCRRCAYYAADETVPKEPIPAGWYGFQSLEPVTGDWRFCPWCGAVLSAAPMVACQNCQRIDLLESFTLNGATIWQHCRACGWRTGEARRFEITFPNGLGGAGWDHSTDGRVAP
jgi:hypothetical protein